jgi:hypothetical protein
MSREDLLFHAKRCLFQTLSLEPSTLGITSIQMLQSCIFKGIQLPNSALHVLFIFEFINQLEYGLEDWFVDYWSLFLKKREACAPIRVPSTNVNEVKQKIKYEYITNKTLAVGLFAKVRKNISGTRACGLLLC